MEGRTTIKIRDFIIPLLLIWIDDPIRSFKINGVIIGAIRVSIMRIERAIPIFPEKTDAQIVPTTAVGIALKRAYPLIIPALPLKKRYAMPTENRGIKIKLPIQ